MNTSTEQSSRIVNASREIAADTGTVFALIADPARHGDWDGNDNVAEAPEGQRVRGVGEAFVVTLTKGVERFNHVVEFEEGRLIAWKPGEQDGTEFGQLWRWEVEESGPGRSRVTHTYDWTELTEPPARIERAKGTTPEKLRASIDRLASIAEGGGSV